MKRHVSAILLAAILLTAGLFVLYLADNKPNQVWEDISSYTPSPLEGVSLSVDASKKKCELSIKNKSERYIVLDFVQNPLYLEVYQNGGWHRVLSSKLVIRPTEAVSSGDTYTDDFLWKEYFNSNLKAGKYRAILFFGNGESEAYEYNTVSEFVIER